MRTSIEPLETRSYLAGAVADIVIPVLEYHRIVDNPTSPDDTRTADFEAQMRELVAKGFTTIGLQQLIDFMTPGTTASVPLKSVVLIFDDAKDEELKVAKWMSDPGRSWRNPKKPDGTLGDFFKAVTAVPYEWVESNQAGHLSWDEIKSLKNDYKWDIASHSYSHKRMGWRPNRDPTSQ